MGCQQKVIYIFKLYLSLIKILKLIKIGNKNSVCIDSVVGYCINMSNLSLGAQIKQIMFEYFACESEP